MNISSDKFNKDYLLFDSRLLINSLLRKGLLHVEDLVLDDFNLMSPGSLTITVQSYIKSKINAHTSIYAGK